MSVEKSESVLSSAVLDQAVILESYPMLATAMQTVHFEVSPQTHVEHELEHLDRMKERFVQVEQSVWHGN